MCCDGIGRSEGQGVDGIPLTFNVCCETLEDLVVSPGVTTLCEARLCVFVFVLVGQADISKRNSDCIIYEINVLTVLK